MSADQHLFVFATKWDDIGAPIAVDIHTAKCLILRNSEYVFEHPVGSSDVLNVQSVESEPCFAPGHRNPEAAICSQFSRALENVDVHCNAGTDLRKALVFSVLESVKRLNTAHRG